MSDIYTMNGSFRKQELIEQYTSYIWTERYSTPGEVEVICPINSNAAYDLMSAKFIGMDGTQEVMLIDSRTIENEQLKVTGPTLAGFFAHRPIRLSSDTPIVQAGTLDGTPGLLLDFLVMSSVGDIVMRQGLERLGGEKNQFFSLTFPRYDAAIDHLFEYIPDETGVWQFAIPVSYGQLLDALNQLAATFDIGYGMYLTDVSESDYSLEFRSYVGTHRTSDQTTHPVVQFSSAMDTLKNIKEVSSIAGYRNVAYVLSTSAAPASMVDPGVAYADASAADALEFDRRVILSYNSDIKYDEGTEDSGDNYTTYILPQLNKLARDILANNNYVRMVDGELVPQHGCIYGVDYTLGDVIELLGFDGAKQKARVTEYIRSKDNKGERAYPTVTLVD